MRFRVLTPCIAAALGLAAPAAAQTVPAVATQNRAPLAPAKYLEMPLGAIKPQGWLQQQLAVMRNGITGRLDEYYPKLKNDNGWLGGAGDGWEETPYWLDGAVPLAHLLGDAALQAKVQKYVDWALAHQRPNGYFGPLTKAERATGVPVAACEQAEDWWPRMVMLKVLQQHYEATRDARVIPFMARYFQYQLASLQTCPLSKWSEWSQARGGDNLMSVYWLYNQTGDKSLLALGDLLNQQTTPWTAFFSGRDWVMRAAANQTGEHWMDRHGVNVGQGLKLPVIRYQATGDPQDAQAFKTGWQDLQTLHGLPAGIFSADEDLHGNLPTQGTELCAIVETMFSLEQAIGITGEPAYMDALERMTYNALPTQTTDDYNNRQYFQVANQVQVTRGVSDFSLPFDHGMNNVFGPYAGYTCCTANMGQGWTKFASHLWYATPDGGLAALEYAPNTVAATAGGVPVSIREETNYPFEDQVRFTVGAHKKATFPLALRIPAWCAQATIMLNGQPLRTEKGGQVVSIRREWRNNDRVTLRLPMHLATSRWARNSRAVERGPLVYALKIQDERTKGSLQGEGDYYEFRPVSPWNYGLEKAIIDDPAKNLVVKTKPLGPRPGFLWNAQNAPVEITATGRRIPGWKLADDVAPQPVTARDEVYKGAVDPQPEQITLIPYGCTKLRVVAFPVVP